MPLSKQALVVCTIACWLPFASPAGADVRFETLTLDDGYPGDFPVSLAQDKQGFLWIADIDVGLVRYDGYEFRSYRADRRQPGSITSNETTSLNVDATGALWIATNAGLNRYDGATDQFTAITTRSASPAGLSNDNIGFSLVDSKGRLWVGTVEGLNRLDAGGERFHQYHVAKGSPGARDEPDNFWTGFEDSRGRLWFGSKVNGGVHLYDPATDTLRQFVHDGTPESPPAIGVRAIAEDRQGFIWLAGSTLARIDPNTMRFETFYLRNQGDNVNPLGLPENAGTYWTVTEDAAGYLWFGTSYSGVIRIAPDRKSWSRHVHDPNDRGSIASARVHAIRADRSGQLWIAGIGGLSRYNPLTDAVDFTQIPTAWSSSGSLEALCTLDDGRIVASFLGRGVVMLDPATSAWSVIPWPAHWKRLEAYRFWPAPDGRLWVALTEEPHLALLDPARAKYEAVPMPGQVSAHYRDRQGRLWFGLSGIGVARLDYANKRIETWVPDKDSAESLGNDFVFDMLEDSQSRFWLAHNDGIDLMERAAGRFAHFLPAAAYPGAPTDGDIHAIVESDGSLWIHSNKAGVSRFDPATGEFTNFPLSTSPIDAVVQSQRLIVNRGRLWWGANRGLASFDFQRRTYHLYGADQGFTESAGDIDVLPDGRLALGFSDRVGLFDPSRIREDGAAPVPVLTALRLGSLGILRPGKDDVHEIDGAPPFATTLTLPHGHAPLTIEFSAVHFANPKANRYAYRMEGLEPEWIETNAGNRRATYTTLPPGKYRFRVKAANPAGLWGEDGTPLNITVLPPWWQTWWAYLAYAFAALLLVASVVRFRTHALSIRAASLESQVLARTRELAEQKAVIEGQAHHLEEIIAIKDRLMTRISHEFRTPLTVILGPLDRLIARTRDDDLRVQLDAIKRNGSRLLRLVNQMLGLARLRSGRAEDGRPVRVAPVVRQVVASFESLAKERGIDLGLGRIEDVFVLATDDALEKIIVNLVSNAIKYSAAGASIRVEATAGGDAGTISVTDSGRGIESARLSHIFEPFERGHDEAERIPGSGIGLALVSELATAYRGRVEVESELGRGSTFRVNLPVVAVDESADGTAGDFSQEARLEVAALRAVGHGDVGPAGTDTARHSILLIEDNPDMRAYLRQVLADAYALDFAEDGEAGLQKAYAAIPDLIVCDIMLPGKDGYEVCHALKSDARTSHVPVIMLTALEGHDERLKGLAEKADDYLTKPFDEAELRQRIANLLDLRAMLQRRYARDLQFDRSAPAGLSGRDQQFLQKLSGYVDRHHADPDLDLAAMASGLAVSERNLQRKLKALVGLSPGEYLRGYRLQRAMERLLAGERPGDVAAAVGFASQAYFSTCFRAQFGFPPSEARERGRKP